MFGAIVSSLGAMKDRAVEASAKAFINRRIEKLGSVTRLALDSRQKTITIELALKGETSPIGVHLAAYEVVHRNEAAFLVVRQAEASREWITTALNEFVVGREFKLPDALRMAL